MRGLFIIVILASACGRDAPATCAQRAKELARWAAEQDGRFIDVPMSHGLTLATAAATPLDITIERGVYVEVLPGGATIGGIAATDAPSDVGRAVDDKRGSEIFIAIDRNAAWRDVAAIAEAISRAGGTRVHLLFSAEAPNPPPTSAIDGELAMQPSELALDMFAMKNIYPRCPAAVEPARTEAWTELEKALEVCDCAVDVAAVRSSVHARVSGRGTRRAVAAAIIDLRPDGRGANVAHPPSAEWQSVASSVVGAATRGPVSFAVVSE